MNGLSSARRFDAFYRAEESNDRCETGYALIASPRDADRNIQANLRLPRQRGTNLENDAPPRLPIPKNATTDAKSPTHRKPSPAMRQPSGSRDYKPPLGPRPAEFASRRSTSLAFSDPSAPSLARISYAAPTSEPYPGLAVRRLISTSVTHQFLDQRESSESGQSSPRQLFFDALQERPLTGEPFDDKAFLPIDTLPGLPSLNSAPHSRLTQDVDFVMAGVDYTSDRRSSVRPNRVPNSPANAALRAARLSATNAYRTPMIVPPSAQRQSSSNLNNHFVAPQRPRGSSPLRAQIPRKAVSAKPAVLATSNHSSVKGPVEESRRAGLLGGAQNDRTLGSNLSRPEEDSSLFGKPPRIAPALSSQTSNVVHPNAFSTNVRTEKLAPPVLRLPARPSTPAASLHNRQSIASLHTGGLGARTVSPTDARRLKRLSILEIQQPSRASGRSLTPELTFGHRAEGSPSRLTVPKLSSHRATPDSTRRPSRGQSLSSRSSFNSLRPPSETSQPMYGNVQVPGNSSAPKNRLLHSPAGMTDDLVPPVPLIPKAYESPSEKDKPDPFSSNLRFGSPEVYKKAVATSQSTTRRPISQTPDMKATVMTSQEARQRRGLTLSQVGSEPNTVSQTRSKPTAMPSRLPPLNLLPLSEPTKAKIAALNDERKEKPTGLRTPSMHRLNAVTPSTPLTASKAVFPSRNFQLDSATKAAPKRRSGTSSQYDLASIFRTAGASPSSHSPRQSASPHVSTSMPRNNDYPQNTRHDSTSATPSGMVSEPRISKLTTLRNRALSKSIDASKSIQALGLSGPQSPPSATGLRRKLSLGWRKSSSMTAQYPQATEEVQTLEQVAVEQLPSPAVDTRESTAGRTPPATHVKPFPRPDSARIDEKLLEATNKPETPPASRPLLSSLRSRSSLLHPAPSLTTRTSSAELNKAVRHDAVADEEMKRLAAKRKDFDAAVKDLDIQTKKAIAREPVTPGLACRRAKLNIYERGEIIDYNHIYFCGIDSAEKVQADLANETTNFGFDDERGDYNIVYGDHLAYRYEVLDPLGKGSFGQVVRCIDYKTGKLVAIKIIRNKKRFHQQALVEVNILKKLREWDPDEKHSMVNFTQSFYFRGHLCISTELLGMNLYEFIKAYEFKGFSLKLIRRFAQQMLGSLTLLHSRNVIHCDLKPENVLLSHPYRSEIKVIDFGSSCLETEKVYTYIQSRFYRSPEVILGMDYGMPIDMWSLGCILAELLIGYPIFPGENEQEQLACIMEVFGPPEKHLIEQSTRKKLFFDSVGKPRVTVSSKGKRRRPSTKTLQQALKCDDEAFLDFITRCLRWDPKRRMKPDEGLKHDFITGQRRAGRARSSAPALNGRASPTKRLGNAQTPGRARQSSQVATMVVLPGPTLPQSLMPTKSGAPPAGQERDAASNPSPVKLAPTMRRVSTLNGLQTNAASKRNSTGAAITSALPRVVPRSSSGRTDLASAAAIASLRPR